VFGKEFKLLRVSMLKFEKVCGREFFELLRASMLKFEVCVREVFLVVESFKFQVCQRKLCTHLSKENAWITL
jgi:hypothetical protein